MTKAWKEAFDGAKPTWPSYSGARRSSMDSGASGTSSGFTRMVRTRPEVPTHVPSAARYCSGTASSTPSGSSAKRPALVTAPRAPASWDRNTSAGDAEPSVRICAAQLCAAAVADLHLDARLLGELLDERLDERGVAARVQGDRLAGGLVVTITAAGAEHQRGEGQQADGEGGAAPPRRPPGGPCAGMVPCGRVSPRRCAVRWHRVPSRRGRGSAREPELVVQR